MVFSPWKYLFACHCKYFFVTATKNHFYEKLCPDLFYPFWWQHNIAEAFGQLRFVIEDRSQMRLRHGKTNMGAKIRPDLRVASSVCSLSKTHRPVGVIQRGRLRYIIILRIADTVQFTKRMVCMCVCDKIVRNRNEKEVCVCVCVCVCLSVLNTWRATHHFYIVLYIIFGLISQRWRITLKIPSVRIRIFTKI